jgi:hypothetical protein
MPRAAKEGMLEMLTGADLGPPPINGFVTTKQYAVAHVSELLSLLHVLFRTVRHMNEHMGEDAPIIISALNRASGAQFTLDDFRRFWNNYEHFLLRLARWRRAFSIPEPATTGELA